MKKKNLLNALMVLSILVIALSGIIIVKKVNETDRMSKISNEPIFSEQDTDEEISDAEPDIKENIEFAIEDGDLNYCFIEIRCDTILNNIDNLDSAKEDFVPSDGIILSTTKVPFDEEDTVFEVLKRVCTAADIQLEYSWTPLYDSYYIEGINHLYEFDCGSQSGWMYKVNDDFPNYGCSSYTVESNDEIVWCYTCQGLGTDVGAEGF